MYATAAVVVIDSEIELKKQRYPDRTQLAWKKRIKNEINRIRGDLAMLADLMKDD